MVITIDGPAGAGKSTVARLLAERLGFEFLDTGAMYRAVALAARDANVPPDDCVAVAGLLETLDVRAVAGRTYLNGDDVSNRIRTPEITALVRPFADNPAVRQYLVECQRRAGEGRNLVTEGRDQGTIVFPEASCKFYLTAEPRERARRRQQDFLRQGRSLGVDEILAEQTKRDEEDAARALAPLRRAADAQVIDNTGLSVDETVTLLLGKVHAAQRREAESGTSAAEGRVESTSNESPAGIGACGAAPAGPSKPLRLVVLETSGLWGAVAVADGAGLLAVRQLTAARKHARDLIPALKELLREQSWEPRTLDALIVDIGPGSYTGLRVGVMAAKTFAYATGVPVVAVESLRVLAESAPGTAGRLWSIVDAQQGLVYVSGYRREPSGEIEPFLPTQIVPASTWAGWLEPGDDVTGPGLEQAAALVPPNVHQAPPAQRQPTAQACWRIGLEAYLAGERSDPWTLDPLYLRPSAAETKWDLRQAAPR